jgi:hypothetical protein
VEARTTVETLRLSASQDPYTSKAKSFHIEEIEKIFEGIINNCCRRSEYVGSSRARCVCVCALLPLFLLLAGSKKAL